MHRVNKENQNQLAPFTDSKGKALIHVVQLFKPQPWPLKTFSELRGEFDISLNHLLHYYQITNFWKSQSRDPSFFMEHSFLDKLVSAGTYSFSEVHSRLDVVYGKSMLDGPPSKWHVTSQ